METMLIQCIQCDVEFEFSIQDQILYSEKGYDEPRRCPGCRKNKSKANVRADIGNKKNRKKLYRMKYADEQY
jgi:hypothetical protein